jgi:hypothetical protein
MHHMKRTNIYLTKPQLKFLGELKQKTGLSIAELVRRAIDLFVKQENGKQNSKE